MRIGGRLVIEVSVQCVKADEERDTTYSCVESRTACVKVRSGA